MVSRAAVLAIFFTSLVASAPTQTDPRTDSLLPRAANINALKSYFGSRYYASAVQANTLNSDSQYNSLLTAQINGGTAENECKMDSVQPNQGQFNFQGCDAVQSFVAGVDGKFRGHTLVWYSQLPGWVNSLQGDALDTAMNNHITTVMTHYKGKAYAWDVVNEALNDDGSYRNSPYYTQLGTDFITKAFQYARAADPDAKLYYNDYNLEYAGPKQDAAYTIVSNLKSQNLIDGVGFQGHLIVGQVPSDIQTSLQRFASLGVDVAFTELDIRAPTPISSADLTQQSTDYGTVISACVGVGSSCVGVTNWGLTDKYSWVSSTFPGQGAALPFDENYQPKPAATAIANAASG